MLVPIHQNTTGITSQKTVVFIVRVTNSPTVRWDMGELK